jgi:hypothetical protein
MFDVCKGRNAIPDGEVQRHLIGGGSYSIRGSGGLDDPSAWLKPILLRTEIQPLGRLSLNASLTETANGIYLARAYIWETDTLIDVVESKEGILVG